MSYILDALKRADAERERGHVPGLHAQPLAGPAAAGTGGGLPRWALWAGGAVGLAVVAALAWRMGADAHAPVPATLAVPATPAATLPATGLPAATAATAPALPPAQEPVALAPVGPTRTQAPALPPAPATAGPPPANTAANPNTVAPAVRPAPTEPAPAAAPANTAIPLYAQLPPGLRQQMPNLAVTGSVYSDDASARFIMLNGDVAKEGSQPAPGLVVERIEPKSAVLRYKGERFRLPY